MICISLYCRLPFFLSWDQRVASRVERYSITLPQTSDEILTLDVIQHECGSVRDHVIGAVKQLNTAIKRVNEEHAARLLAQEEARKQKEEKERQKKEETVPAVVAPPPEPAVAAVAEQPAPSGPAPSGPTPPKQSTSWCHLIFFVSRHY